MKNIHLVLSSLLALVTTAGCASLCFLSGTCPAAPGTPRPDGGTDKPRYATCAAVKAAKPDATDGEYQLTTAQGKSWTAYCAMSADQGPAEYLDLAGANYSKYQAGAYAVGTTASRTFQRVRILPEQLAIVPDDKTYTTADGALIVNSADGTRHAQVEGPGFGTAANCNGEQGAVPGTARIDLTGTPFAVVANQFAAFGYGGNGAANYSKNDQVVTINGAGACGGYGPKGNIQLKFYP